MSASEHLSPKLFHGTAHEFGPEEIIKPTQESHPLEGKQAFATTSLVDATHWAGKAAQRAGMLFGPVHEVEAKDAVRHPYGMSTYVSRIGFTPKKVVGWGINPDIQD